MIGVQLRKWRKKGGVAAALTAPLLSVYEYFFDIYKVWRLKYVPDEAYVKQEFYRKFRYPLPLSNPQTFNEKIHWRKLYERNPFFVHAADKYAVRDYVQKTIGREYLVPLLQVVEKETDLRFEDLPRCFVVKGSHDCGSTTIIRDKHQYGQRRLRKNIRNILRKRTYYTHLREWQYQDIPARVLIEELLLDQNGQVPPDFKLHVFNQKTEMIQVANAQHTKNAMYSPEWERLPFSMYNPQPEKEVPRPPQLKKMIALAEALAHPVHYVRVDLFNVDGRIYFGELTFTPNNGDAKFDPPEYDLYYGKKFTLDWRFHPDPQQQRKHHI